MLAIESSITRPYADLGLRALGFFVIHVSGKSYGVRSPDATMLACSVDSVRRRIARRGTHRICFGSESDAAKVADAMRAAMYDESSQNERLFDMSAEEVRDTFVVNEIVWAPDGDAAFDDGSHVLQFDQGDRVRLIAFKNTGNKDDVARTLAQAWIGADEFYELLEKWLSVFDAEWAKV